MCIRDRRWVVRRAARAAAKDQAGLRRAGRRGLRSRGLSFACVCRVLAFALRAPCGAGVGKRWLERREDRRGARGRARLRLTGCRGLELGECSLV
eukprot:5348950-Alexandrium_andersonii.AAC.1